MAYQNIFTILNLLEEYENSGRVDDKNLDLDNNFALWLLSRSRLASGDVEKEEQNIDGQIGMLLGFMGRYVEYYSKRLFKNSPIYSFTDFGFMMSLFPDKSLTRTELIKANLMEKSSGTEVIKRLMRNGLVHEIVLENRLKRIELSKLGKIEISNIQENIARLSKHLTGDLSVDEKYNLIKILAKLHFYHKPVFDKADEKEINKIIFEDKI
jgi:DNA-binding MarR family transcriptional regulator